MSVYINNKDLPIVVSIAIAVVLVIASYFLAVQSPDRKKLSAYECGFQPYSDAREKLEVRFFLVAILFIFFLFIWTRAFFSRIRFDNLMHLGWKSFLSFVPIAYKFNLLNLFSISQSNLKMQPIASTVSTSSITQALLYFKLHPYCIHFVYSALSNKILYLIVFTDLSCFNPVLAATFIVSLLSSGIPPLSRFFGKWLVFSSAIHSQFYLLAIFDVLSSVILAFYFQLHPYCIHFVSSAFYTFFLQLSSLYTSYARSYFIKLGAIGLKIFFH